MVNIIIPFDNGTLFEAFQLVFKTNRKIENDGKHMKFSVSSTKDLKNVVKFFSSSGLHPLQGLKAKQYNIWLTSLKANKKKVFL